MKPQPLAVTIPLLNANEPEALLTAIHVVEGQQVSEGDLLCTIETTKSTSDLTAEAPGYVVGLNFQQGQTARAGDILCFLAESADWGPRDELSPLEEVSSAPSSGIPEGLRITQPGLALARGNMLDLSQFSIGPMVTAQMVKSMIEKSSPVPAFSVPPSSFDPTSIIVYGAGGHGKSLVDMLHALGTYRIIGFIDDGQNVKRTFMGLPVLGGRETLSRLHDQGTRMAVNAVGGIGNIAIRVQVYRWLAEAGFVCPTVVHPTAYVEPSAALSPGVQVFPHAYVGSGVNVGFGAIVNTGSILSHDCTLSDYVNIAPGTILAGEVQVGEGTLIGMGVTVNLQVIIGAGARVGNGATVKADVPENGVVRAGTIWPK